jgi:tripartite ATP-independent transporter DctM subunit
VHWVAALVLMFGGIIFLMGMGIPVAFAFLLLDLLGVLLFMGGTIGISQLVNNAFSSLTLFALAPVPLFLLMGELFFHTGLAVRVFDAFDKLLGRIPARLSVITVASGTLFAALSGSSLANTALMGSLMVPEMTKRGYKPSMSVGPIMGSGGLAILIPPSALAVLLGTIAQIDIGNLLIAGIGPGIVLASLYIAWIFVLNRIDPTAAPSYDVPVVSFAAKLRALCVDVLPMSFIIFNVMGLMMLGWATPTEAAAFGAVAVVILAVLYRCMSWQALVRSVKGALRVTVMSFMIILASSTFSQILAFSGASSGMIEWALGFQLPDWVLLLIMFGILLILGCFMDQLSMLLLTVPLFFPLAKELGFDLIWFGVIVMMSLEIGYTTPPFGLLLFVMKGVAPPGTTMEQIIVAAIPYILCAMLTVALIVIFPDIPLFLTRIA